MVHDETNVQFHYCKNSNVKTILIFRIRSTGLKSHKKRKLIKNPKYILNEAKNKSRLTDQTNVTTELRQNVRSDWSNIIDYYPGKPIENKIKLPREMTSYKRISQILIFESLWFTGIKEDFECRIRNEKNVIFLTFIEFSVYKM